MRDLLRDAPAGACLRLLTGDLFLKHLEEQDGFELPSNYGKNHYSKNADVSATSTGQADFSDEGIETERANVTWYGPDDPANPFNWSRGQKNWTGFVILFYTFAIYIGSSLYTASEADVARIFGVSEIAASLGLSLYVIAYGVGPLLWSPLSEIPAVGRNAPYVITFGLFLNLCVPTALVDNFPGLMILRILLGFFGSPALATGGASYGDFVSSAHLPYAIALWGAGATLGPSLGPVVSGFAVQFKGWRWSSWELLWISAPAFVLMFFALPETSSDLILLQRARRLRKLTGRSDLRASSEIKQKTQSTSQVIFDALIKPWEINIKDPAMVFTTIYTALIYGIFYPFFESFPLVYEGMYGWGLGLTGLAFLSVLAGLFVAISLYCAYFYFIGDPRMAKKEAQQPKSVQPEERLVPGLAATFCILIGLFVYAWTARADIFFLPSLLGVTISMLGIIIITLSMCIYLPFTYPTYAGSLFAANGFARAAFAAGSILFARPMFERLGIDGGVSFLAGLTVLCCFGIYILFFYGRRLRQRSKFAAS